MVKFALILVALLALVAGGVMMLIPDWYVSLAGVESPGLAWMRLFGASLVTLQGFGLLIAAFRRRDTNPLLAFLSLASSVESGVLWYALVAGEVGAGALWAVIVPGIVATASSVLLWGSWLSRRKSVKSIGSPEGAPVAGEAGADDAGMTEPPAMDGEAMGDPKR